MLLNFSLENWMSFRNPVTFSMVAGKERQHGNRVPRLHKYHTRVLPIAAIYGGNASGKSNLFKALDFAKTLVVEGTRPNGAINATPFLLNGAQAGQPTRLGFILLVGDDLYEFSFAVTRQTVLQERLVKIGPSSETTLYEREGQRIKFDDKLGKEKRLEFAFEATRENQLFLTNSVVLNQSAFRHVYDWFKDTLELIAPDNGIETPDRFFSTDHPLFATMNGMLSQLDTGITRLGEETMPFPDARFPEDLKEKLQQLIPEGQTWKLPNDRRRKDLSPMVITKKDGDLVMKRLVTYHQTRDGGERQFEMSMESDGTQRVIDLLPTFVSLVNEQASKVYVIDEIDRSLHTHLTRVLLATYLSACSPHSRSQLLMTTHDVLQMDQDLLRRDEMWVTERDADGASDLFSFSDYKEMRYDKDIRKSYLQGRLGGVPGILTGTLLFTTARSHSRQAEEASDGEDVQS